MAKVVASPAQRVAGARRRPKMASAPNLSNSSKTSAISKDDIDMDMLEEILLGDTWVLWFDRYIGPGFSAEEYAAAVKEVCTFNTVQGFWCWYNNLPAASTLDSSCTYHLMKKGIKPLWYVHNRIDISMCVSILSQKLTGIFFLSGRTKEMLMVVIWQLRFLATKSIMLGLASPLQLLEALFRHLCRKAMRCVVFLWV